MSDITCSNCNAAYYLNHHKIPIKGDGETSDCMGTLFNQTPRQDRLEKGRIVAIGKEVKEIGKELGVSFNDALNLYLAVAKISDYDTKDEQLAGFGELLQALIERLSERD